MGQFRPSGLVPSTLTQTYTIDATVDNVFTCNINGTSPTIKYELKIMKNDTSSTIVYDSGVVSLSSPLYPVNFDGTVNQLAVTVPSDSGMVNGNEYKWTIASYWSDSDFYTSYDNVFKAYSSPTLSISNFQSTITSKSYTFVADCQQAQGVGVEKFGWILRDAETKQEIINTIDSNNIYSSDVQMFYDGFLNGSTEEIMVKCWLLNGVEISTDFQEFNVSYDVSDFTSLVTVNQLSDSGILVQWSGIYYIYGETTNDDYSYITNDDYIGRTYINLQSGNTLSFNQVSGKPISFPTTCSHIIGFTAGQDNPSIYRASGFDSKSNPYFIEVSISSGILYLNINGDINPIYNILPLIDTWIILQISPSGIMMITYADKLVGLYPNETLYPSNVLYPIDSEQGSNKKNIIFIPNIISDGYFSNISLSGPQSTLFTWIKKEPLTQADFNLFLDPTYVPSWDPQTYLLATYQGDLNAGNTYASSNVVGWLIYRLESDYPALKMVAVNQPDETFVIDYMAKNQLPINYYVFPSFETEIGRANISETFTPTWWSWYLITCNKNSNDVYTMQNVYEFDLDVSSGSMSNNTSFNVLENFTQYAKIQNSNSNYWTGTISSLLGNCSNNYSDTTKQMTEIKSLTTDGLDKFLKDRKGNVWKVKLNSSVTEQINDAYIEQAVNINISWMEIGSAVLSQVTQDPNVTQSEANSNIVK